MFWYKDSLSLSLDLLVRVVCICISICMSVQGQFVFFPVLRFFGFGFPVFPVLSRSCAISVMLYYNQSV